LVVRIRDKTGPILLLDRAVLESLSIDEVVWLDMFFGVNLK
jgi:hypothetical protein